MKLATIDIDPELAKEKFEEYKRAVQSGRKYTKDENDELLMRTYRKLAQGEQVIDLIATIKAGGKKEHSYNRLIWRDNHAVWETWYVDLPRIAIARADQELLYIRRQQDGSGYFYKEAQTPFANETRYVTRVPEGTFKGGGSCGLSTFYSLVPSIPPNLRPRYKVKNYHVLYEAEWIETAKSPRAPIDPALLRHIGGDLYVVVSVWDLTDLERRVLGIHGR